MTALIAEDIAGCERGTALGAEGWFGLGHGQDAGAPQWPQNFAFGFNALLQVRHILD